MTQPFQPYEPDAETVRRAACFDELVAALRKAKTCALSTEVRAFINAALAKAEAKP